MPKEWTNKGSKKNNDHSGRGRAMRREWRPATHDLHTMSMRGRM